jgi:hypothetical protein
MMRRQFEAGRRPMEFHWLRYSPFPPEAVGNDGRLLGGEMLGFALVVNHARLET